MSGQDRQCMTCAWFDPIDGRPDRGFCRRAPPAPQPWFVSIDQSGERKADHQPFEVVALWPIVGVSDWCAQYREHAPDGEARS